MHATQTTPAAVQAAEAVSPIALKAKARALKPLTLADAIAAARDYKAGEYTGICDEHFRLADDASDARQALNAVPFPAALTVQAKSLYIVSIGKIQEDGSLNVLNVEPPSQKLEDADAVLAYFDGDASAAAPLLAELVAWETGTRELRAAVKMAEAKEARSDKVYDRALTKLTKVSEAILAAPATSVDEILMKLSAYAEVICDRADIAKLNFYEDASAALLATARDLRNLANKPPASPAAVVHQMRAAG